MAGKENPQKTREETPNKIYREVPPWARKFISSKQAQEVEEQLQLAELKSRVEFVIVVAQKSSPTRHVFPLLSLAFAATAFLVGLWTYEMAYHDIAAPGLSLLSLMTLPLAFLLSRLSWVQRFVTDDRDERRSVAQRAELEFYRARAHQTEEGTSVLIFISMMERRALILGDAKLGVSDQFWQSALNPLLSGLKRRQLASGLLGAFEVLKPQTELLSPVGESNPNELKDHIRFVL